MIFDDTVCQLGEGPLWHPIRNQLFWFDILGKTLFWRAGDTRHSVAFDGYASAAGWIDDAQLLVATETDLRILDVTTKTHTHLMPFDADNPVTRSNDGRVDPFGGFWIGTMGKSAEAKAGAIYRYYRGELRQLFGKITISNAICFSPDGLYAFFTDTIDGRIMRQPLDQKDGWPKGDAEVWLDLRGEKFGADGAVIDASGCFWNAQWGAGRVACYDTNGTFQRAISFGADQTSCPAFGGDDFTTLYCTSAAEGGIEGVDQGKTWLQTDVAKGQKEHQVIL